MRAVRRLVIMTGLVMLALSSSGHAACGPGNEDCEPAIDVARAKLQRLLASAYVTPHVLVSLKKLDGRSLETQDRKLYELRFLAVLNYSGDRLTCRQNLCPELHNYLVQVDRSAKTATIAGWLFLEQGPQGWH